MFPEMRRKKQQLSNEETEEIFRRGSHGVLALLGNEGWPYALPISYVYNGGKLYFHCALAGHKLEAIAREPRASFCVVDADEVIPELFTSAYRSAIAFGRLRVLENREEIIGALELLCGKYSPGLDTTEEIEKFLNSVCVLEMSVEHMSGKEGLEFLRRRNKDGKK